MNERTKLILLEALKDVKYKQIVLFGSRARGTNNEESDYDILVIVDDNIDMRAIRKIECNIRKIMASYLIDVDILVRTNQMIEKYRKVSGTVIYEAMKEGVLI